MSVRGLCPTARADADAHGTRPPSGGRPTRPASPGPRGALSAGAPSAEAVGCRARARGAHGTPTSSVFRAGSAGASAPAGPPDDVRKQSGQSLLCLPSSALNSEHFPQMTCQTRGPREPPSWAQASRKGRADGPRRPGTWWGAGVPGRTRLPGPPAQTHRPARLAAVPPLGDGVEGVPAAAAALLVLVTSGLRGPSPGLELQEAGDSSQLPGGCAWRAAL